MSIVSKLDAQIRRGWLRATAPAPAGSREGGGEQGSTTVEYAIGAIATAGFAGLLIAVLKSGGVRGLLDGIIRTALTL